MKHRNHALAGEHVAHGTRFSHVTAVLRHGGAHFGGSPVAVVGKTFNENGHPVGTIAFVHDGLPVGAAGLFTGATFAGAFNIVIGDGGFFGFADHVIQRGVGRWIPTASSGRNLNVFNQPGKFFATLGIICGFFVFCGCPF